jgi:hypothetical protein
MTTAMTLVENRPPKRTPVERSAKKKVPRTLPVSAVKKSQLSKTEMKKATMNATMQSLDKKTLDTIDQHLSDNDIPNNADTRAEVYKKMLANQKRREAYKNKRDKIRDTLTLINQLPIFVAPVVIKKEKTVMIPFRVVINVVEYLTSGDYHWTRNETINSYENKPLVFVGKNPANLEKDIELFLKRIYPHQVSDIIVDLQSFTYKATLPPKKHKVNVMNMPMKIALPYKLCFLKHFNDIDNYSYENHNGQCVINMLTKHLKLTEKHLIECFNTASIQLYAKKYKKKDGITSAMLLHLCKSKNISLLGFDDNDKLFVKFANDDKKTKKYKSIIYYMAMTHLYIITDESVVRHISQTHKNGVNFSSQLEPTEEKEELKTNIVYDNTLEQCQKLPPFSYNILTCNSNITLNDFLKECVQQKLLVKVKHSSLTIVKEIQLTLGKNHNITITEGYDTPDNLSTATTLKVCESIKKPFKNQSIGNLLLEIQQQFYNPKRQPIPAEMKQLILKEQMNMCNICKKCGKMEFDHKLPVSAGGLTERNNLQALCPECHKEKSLDEQSSYFQQYLFTSCLNLQANEILNGKFSRKVAFNHYFDSLNNSMNYYYPTNHNDDYSFQDVQKKYPSYFENIKDTDRIKSIDINKCRRNNMCYGKYNFPVYSVLDNWDRFDGKIEDGNYYVETLNYFPFHGNGVYNRAMVEYGIEKEIIIMDNIKYQYKCASVLKDNYFQPFMKHILDTFAFDTKAQKLAPNSYIGVMGRRRSSHINSKFCDINNRDQLGLIHQKFNNPHISKITDEICLVSDMVYTNSLETNFYIHSHILDLEAIEAHKLYTILLEHNCIPLCVKTDAIIYIDQSKNNNAIDINRYYFDDNKTVLKYKFEKVKWLKTNILLAETKKMFIEFKSYNQYDNADIYTDETFDNIADKIIQSNEGVLMNGLAGTGKSYFIKKLVEKVKESNKVLLAPTNKSARIIKGGTLDKFCYSVLKSPKSINKIQKYDYIFVDEISMVRESFYKVLLMLKNANPDIKFIICGDFNQLPPVLDIIDNRSYKNSQCLRELVDNNKLILTKCKRSDDALFNLCGDLLEDKHVDTTPFKNGVKNYLNICFTNERRKIINAEAMNRFIKAHPTLPSLQVEKLSYDDNTQNYTLVKGMPLIARKNLKEMDIFNNEIYICDGFDDNNVFFKIDYEDTIVFPIKKLNKYFNLAFCITTHKSQGATFDETYTIHEWEKMGKPLKYVALSRATNINNITIA